jgi:hypothetical protein
MDCLVWTVIYFLRCSETEDVKILVQSMFVQNQQHLHLMSVVELFTKSPSWIFDGFVEVLHDVVDWSL